MFFLLLHLHGRRLILTDSDRLQIKCTIKSLRQQDEIIVSTLDVIKSNLGINPFVSLNGKLLSDFLSFSTPTILCGE